MRKFKKTLFGIMYIILSSFVITATENRERDNFEVPWKQGLWELLDTLKQEKLAKLEKSKLNNREEKRSNSHQNTRVISSEISDDADMLEACKLPDPNSKKNEQSGADESNQTNPVGIKDKGIFSAIYPYIPGFLVGATTTITMTAGFIKVAPIETLVDIINFPR